MILCLHLHMLYGTIAHMHTHTASIYLSTSCLSSAAASLCTSVVSRAEPLNTLLRLARLVWTVCTSLTALYLSRYMKASIGESTLLEGGESFLVISSEPYR